MNAIWHRRAFLRTSLGVAGIVPWAGALAASVADPSPKSPPVVVFSKHFQFMNYREMARVCRELGLDGVDLTVRRDGHVEPEQVTRDLPAAVEAIREQGLQVPMITTRLNRGDDPDAVPILKTASQLGIRFFRIGGFKYDGRTAPGVQLKTFTESLRSLARVAATYGMTAGYHNHSGRNQVGGPVWDLHRMLSDVNSPHLGSNFDVGHATIEGAGGAWETHARLMAPQVKMMAVKDFSWQDGKRSWVPLGEGQVQLVPMLKIMRGAGFRGPISIHVEYKVASPDAMIKEVGHAAAVLRRALKATH